MTRVSSQQEIIFSGVEIRRYTMRPSLIRENTYWLDRFEENLQEKTVSQRRRIERESSSTKRQSERILISDHSFARSHFLRVKVKLDRKFKKKKEWDNFNILLRIKREC